MRIARRIWAELELPEDVLRRVDPQPEGLAVAGGVPAVTDKVPSLGQDGLPGLFGTGPAGQPVHPVFLIADLPGLDVVRLRAQGLILEAMDSGDWDWFEVCDGCTGVSQLHWPTKYFPPCLRHDYDWATGNGGLTGSKNFYDLQRAYGVPKWRSGLRAGVVTAVWYAWRRRVK